jgi:LuxR family maltose regulon positive regulatory protein
VRGLAVGTATLWVRPRDVVTRKWDPVVEISRAGCGIMAASMTESIDGSAARVAAPPDGLLATKLHVPPSRPSFVARPRLTAQLDKGLQQALILVSAPAGFGKTSLLADWSQRNHRGIAWVALDSDDNDPVRLWRHVTVALDRVRPGSADRIGPVFGPPAPRSFDAVAAALINEFDGQSGDEEVVLVLDDYHLIESPVVHRSVTFLVEHLPPRLHLVVSARADPPLPLARLRVAGQLAEFRARDLRFTREEAAAVLREASGQDLPLSEASLAALDVRTEGWAAGLQLAALSLRDHPDVDRFIASFSGSHRYVLDYLTEEVLERQPPDVRSFLLETSVLERLSGGLCDAVTGRTDGQAMLEAIERANLFLVPLDEVRGWWRYHHLFADLLRIRLSQERPGRLEELHRIAAGWHRSHGLADDAVRHALAAGDPALAARLVEYYADSWLQGGREVTLSRWVAALPAELVAARPRLLLARSLGALLVGDLPVLEESLEAAELAFTSHPDQSFETSVGRQASWMGNVPAMIARGRGALAEFRGDADEALAFSRKAVELLAEGELMLDGLTRTLLGKAERLSGRLEDAERTLSHVLERSDPASQPALVAWTSHLLGQVQQARGDLHGAGQTYRKASELTPASRQPASLAGAIVNLGLAEVAYQRDELEDAWQHITRAIELSRRTGNATLLASALTTLAWIRQAQGDPTGAREALGQAEAVGLGSDVVDLINPTPARRARLLLVQDDGDAAAAWVRKRALSADDDPAYAREPAYLTLARVLRAQGRAAEAAGLLERLHARARKQDRAGSLIEIQALRALALADVDDKAGALSALSTALRLGEPQGYVRIFADEGGPMRSLLERFLVSASTLRAGGEVSAHYVGRLVAVIEADAARSSVSSRDATKLVVPGMVEALSHREVEVLKLLAAGKANRDIADELYVTLHTVKKHITHILGKLGAANRTEAAARARDLGLLDQSEHG